MIKKFFKQARRARSYLNVTDVLTLRKFRELRVDYYRHLWQEAATNIGAGTHAGRFGYLRISRDGLTTIVKQGSVMLDSYLTLDIMGHKALTYALMAEKNYPIPDHQAFTMSTLQDAEAMLARQGGKPVVVKPICGTGGGRGVTTGITSLRSLRQAAWMAAQFGDDLMVEEQADGESFRLLYIGGQLVDAIRRDQPEIMGDGRHSIRKLVAIENQRRLAETPTVALSPLRIDRDCTNFLERQGLAPRSVLAEGCGIQVKRAVNENRAERNHSVSDQVHPETVEMGRRLVSDFGVEFAGLDVLCKDISAPLTRTNGWISEVNTSPGIHHHYLTANPASRVHVAEKVLDYIFGTQHGAMKLGLTPSAPFPARASSM